jgi:hypothetical protein
MAIGIVPTTTPRKMPMNKIKCVSSNSLSEFPSAAADGMGYRLGAVELKEPVHARLTLGRRL